MRRLMQPMSLSAMRLLRCSGYFRKGQAPCQDHGGVLLGVSASQPQDQELLFSYGLGDRYTGTRWSAMGYYGQQVG